MIEILFCALYGLGVYLSPANQYTTQSFLGLSVMAMGLSIVFCKQFNWLLGLTYAYFAIHSLLRISFPQYFWQGFELETIVGFQSLVAEAFVWLTLFYLFFHFITLEGKKVLRSVLCLMVIIDCTILWYKFLTHQDPWFILNNSALDTSLISCGAGLILATSSRKFTIFFTMLIGVFILSPLVFTKTSSGILGLSSLFGCFIWAKNKYRRDYFIYGLGLCFIFSVIGYAIQRDVLWNSSGRYDVWKLMMETWYYQFNRFFGQGLGTFHIYGPSIQMADAILKGQTEAGIPGFFWMHNDWLQILFEGGILGLILSVACFIFGVLKSKDRPWLFSSLVTFGALAIIQMPLRHFTFSLLGAYLFAESISSPKKTSDENRSYYDVSKAEAK